jgi:CheY-like chemotaxis protein
VVLRPRVLYVDDAIELRALVQLQLMGLGCDVALADSAQHACEALEARGPFDVVLLDVQLGNEDVTRVVEQIHAAGHQGRLVTVSAGPAPASIPTHGHLSKPMARDALAVMVREGFPVAVWSVPPPVSRLAEDRTLVPLLHQFVVILDGRARELEAIFGAKDTSALRRILHMLEGSAGSYGFDEITREAREVGEQLNRGVELGDIAPAVVRLRKLCSRARAA